MQEDTFYQIRRELHQHPELSGHEARTARFVEDKLQVFHPTKVIRHVGGHGLLVEYFFSEDGPTVLFRADMDAVAVQEPDDIPHHSQTPGVAHKCGHDGPHHHTTPVCSNAVRTSVDKRTCTATFPTGRRERYRLKSRARHESTGVLPDR